MDETGKQNSIFKILSIDGGGIRGIYSAHVLAQFEKTFDCNLVDYFDLICGTSTGGLIALALSLGIPASEVADFYRKKGALIFPKLGLIKGLYRQVIRGGKFDNSELKKALSEIYEDKIIADSKCLLCIPSFSLTDAKPWIFRYDHSDGDLSRDNQTSYVDVALATSAAPTYLPIVEIENYEGKQFIDGGVCANNPSMVGITEAFRYFVGANKQFDNLMIMSIASLEAKAGFRVVKNKKRSAIDWNKDLIVPFSEGQAHTTSFTVETLSKHCPKPFDYLRIPSPHYSSNQSKLVSLDNSTDEALIFMTNLGKDQGLLYEKMSETKNFFATKKKYIIK